MLHYLKNAEEFIKHRLEYYADTSSITLDSLEETIFPRVNMFNDYWENIFFERKQIVERLKRVNNQIIIVTATHNRLESIIGAYQALQAQEGPISWNWLIVDNGVENRTRDYIRDIADERVLYVKYLEKTGCAFPVRNFGLDIIHYAKYHTGHTPYIMLIDSDDKLHNSNSLRELLSLTHYKDCNKYGKMLFHGYTVSEIIEENKPIINVPNPRDWGSSFPKVNSLKEVFDKGLNILSGAFPIELLSWLRYPQEFSFEDDGFNQKILLQAKLHKNTWLCENYPITIKRFHQQSMSGSNNLIGDTSKVNKIGLHQTTGVRADIVSYLKSITDYYTSEGL